MSKRIHNLIHSLSKSEKRHISLRANIYKKSSNHQRLITALEKQKEYDEKKLIQQFQGESFVKHIRVSLNDLYLFVIKTLREFHAEHSVESKIRVIIDNIEILFNKGFYEGSLKELKKGVRLCEQYELFSYLNILIDWKRKINRISQNSIMTTEYIKTDWEMKNEIIENEKIFNETWKISMKAFNLYLSANIEFTKDIPKQLLHIINDKIWIDAAHKKLFRPLLLQNNVKLFYYQLIDNKEKSIHYSLKNVQELEENTAFIKAEPNMYIITKANSIAITLDSGDIQKSIEFMDEFEETLNSFSIRSNTSSYILIIQHKYFLDLKLYNLQGEFKKSTLLCGKYKTYLSKNESKIGELSLMKIYYEMAYAYYGTNMLKESLIYLNKILLTTDFSIGLNTYHINLLQLIVHYELGNFDITLIVTKKLHRIIYAKSPDLNSFEKILLEFLNFVLKNGDFTKDFLIRMEKEIRAIEDDYLSKSILENFDFIAWINSKIEHKDFNETVRDKYLKTTSFR